MGTEYTLVNHKNKTLFEMGRGNYIVPMWTHTNDDLLLFLYRETFVPYFVERCKENFDYLSDAELTTNLPYYTKLANTIFDFIEGADPEKDLDTVNDEDDRLPELRERGYIFLGSRYTGMSDYHAYIVEKNTRSKSPLDWSQIDFTWSIKRIRQLLVFM